MLKLGRYVSYLIVPLSFIIVLAVIMRYVFDAMPQWAFEISLFIYGTHFMLGGGYTHLRKKHVSVDIIQKYVSPAKRRMLDYITELTVAFTSLVLLYVSFGWARESIRIMERSMHQTTFDPPIWWFKSVVPVAAALLLLAAVKNMWKLHKSAETGE